MRCRSNRAGLFAASFLLRLRTASESDCDLRMCQTSSLMLPSWAAAQEASAVKLLEVRSQILETCIIESAVPSPEFSQQEQCIVSYVTLGETAVLQSESFFWQRSRAPFQFKDDSSACANLPAQHLWLST